MVDNLVPLNSVQVQEDFANDRLIDVSGAGFNLENVQNGTYRMRIEGEGIQGYAGLSPRLEFQTVSPGVPDATGRAIIVGGGNGDWIRDVIITVYRVDSRSVLAFVPRGGATGGMRVQWTRTPI